MMEIFRIENNPWGQEILLGLSWDLLWVFFGAGRLFIVVHILYKLIWAPNLKDL